MFRGLQFFTYTYINQSKIPFLHKVFGSHLLMSHKKKSPEFYEYYPKLFHDYFPDIDKVTIDLLSKAGFYFYQSILQLDAVIDNQENHRIY